MKPKSQTCLFGLAPPENYEGKEKLVQINTTAEQAKKEMESDRVADEIKSEDIAAHMSSSAEEKPAQKSSKSSAKGDEFMADYLKAKEVMESRNP